MWVKVQGDRGATYLNLRQVVAVRRGTRDYPSHGGVSTYPVLRIFLPAVGPQHREAEPVQVSDPEDVRMLEQCLELLAARDRRELETAAAAA